MGSIPWRRPRGALHDLEHWQSIDEGAQTVLVLSSRTLYLLQNVVALDLAMASRYIADTDDTGYYPPEPGTEEYDTFVSAYELAQREVIDVSGIAHVIYESGFSDSFTYNVLSDGQHTIIWPDPVLEYPIRIDGAEALNIDGSRGLMTFYYRPSAGATVRLAIYEPDRNDLVLCPPGVIVAPGGTLRVIANQLLEGDDIVFKVAYSKLLGDW